MTYELLSADNVRLSPSLAIGSVNLAIVVGHLCDLD